MSYTDFTYAVGDFVLWTTDIVFENVGNIFNYAVVILGFCGAIYWVKLLQKYKKNATNHPEIME